MLPVDLPAQQRHDRGVHAALGNVHQQHRLAQPHRRLQRAQEARVGALERSKAVWRLEARDPARALQLRVHQQRPSQRARHERRVLGGRLGRAEAALPPRRHVVGVGDERGHRHVHRARKALLLAQAADFRDKQATVLLRQRACIRDPRGGDDRVADDRALLLLQQMHRFHPARVLAREARNHRRALLAPRKELVVLDLQDVDGLELVVVFALQLRLILGRLREAPAPLRRARLAFLEVGAHLGNLLPLRLHAARRLRIIHQRARPQAQRLRGSRALSDLVGIVIGRLRVRHELAEDDLGHGIAREVRHVRRKLRVLKEAHARLPVCGDAKRDADGLHDALHGDCGPPHGAQVGHRRLFYAQHTRDRALERRDRGRNLLLSEAHQRLDLRVEVGRKGLVG
eukprot:Opistho-1_new@76037